MILLDPPIDIGREEAARAAREELVKRIYHEDEPGVVSRALQWLYERILEFLAQIASNSPGGYWGIIAVVLLVVLLVILIRWRVGKLARSRARADAVVFEGRTRTAAEHRSDAEAAALAGDFEKAVRERFRAIVRDLEERTLIDERLGRTAYEVSTEVALVAPDAAEPMRAAATVFDEVCYGSRPGSEHAYGVVKQADEAIRSIRRRAARVAG
ncbi:DUF4129 domain-containing protein [Tenggerimyces flavus]|uniref:DUF4129 domain-containing protein n=1 Tax=Tenggerimyces flavus TaxID=1708749 RepID=A0ABV7YLS8_9ACTN|nr:DUF4129 domain-containing protein [Tenggerimyces flavus]MBM7786203.1 hypothetical protein [Tenggerimyces flavus]